MSSPPPASPTSGDEAAGALLARLARGTPGEPAAIGRYDVIGRLGQGGMGTVYEAIDRDRGVRVALKTLQAPDAAAGVRLKREFRVVADLAHPNLAPVYELGTEGGLWFFTMELVDGVPFTRWACGERGERPTVALPMTQALTEDMPTQPLASTFEDGPGPAPAVVPGGVSPLMPAVSWSALRDALAELASGLSALHDAGLWHGDVKPDNVLIRPDGRVVVVDFGLVDAIGARGATSDRRRHTMGTPTYMASEQLSGAGAGPASDWYAVGTMLYEVLTRRLPFEADSMLDLYFQKTHHTPPSPRELAPGVPEDLSDTCMALLQPAPDRRPSGTQLVRLFVGDDRARVRLADQPVRSIFVGRKRELRMIEQAYGLARGGSPMIVHALGPSGIGKSALLHSFTRGVEDIDAALVLRGRCYERESIPYKAFDGIVDDLATYLGRAREGTRLPAEHLGELAQVFPALSSVPAIALRAAESRAAVAGLDATLLRTRAWIALRELLAGIASDRAVVLAIDDLHWADADSARLLESIVAHVQEVGRVHMLIVAGYRTAEALASPVLAGYFERCRALAAGATRKVVEVSLWPLPPSEAEQLARSALRGIGGTASAARLRFLADEASGVPFFIEELARFAAARELGDATAVTLDDAIRARVQTLPDDQRALVETVAIAAVPIAQSLAFVAAGVPAGALAALLALRSASLLGWTGAGTADLVSMYHDRIREAVVGGMDEGARTARHRALGRAVVARHATGDDAADGAWLYQALRHLAGGGAHGEEVARLGLRAGRLARRTAAFPLAFECFERGIAALGAPDDDATSRATTSARVDAWDAHYELALDLYGGAAEAAYLCAAWEAMDRHCATVLARGRTPLDRLVAWETQIDAHVGRNAYRAALAAGREALAQLGVALPLDVEIADLVAAVEHAVAGLARIGGADGLAALPDVTDPQVAAAMRVQVRLAPAAYFGHQLLLPVMACNLVEASIASGLSVATPYALALLGLVLNTFGRYAEAHVYGTLAVSLIERWPDRRHEAATRHVAWNLVLPWLTPLRDILAPLREVWDIGRRTGDLEYASYAAHGYAHDCMYAGLPLGPLVDEALQLGAQMRALGQVNAVHVHAPFEQLLKALTGRLPTPPSLDDARFSERGELAAAAAAGSRSGILVQELAIGLARFHLGTMADALAHFDVAHAHRDAGPSVWHQPILHQFRAIAACAVLGDRPDVRAAIDDDLAALRVLAGHAPVNFAHRVLIVEGALAQATGEPAAAAACFARALALATDGAWTMDVAVIHRLAGDLARAAEVYAAWGATAVAAHLTTPV